MLYATGKSTRRLLRRGDDIYPGRNGKHWPEKAEVPEDYVALVDFAKARYASDTEKGTEKKHPLLALVGLGAEIWSGVDPDRYVRGLREGWD